MEAEALAALIRGDTPALPAVARTATLRALSVRFLAWVNQTSELDANTRRYYRYGWRLLSFSRLADRRVDNLTTDEIACTTLTHPARKDPSVMVPCSTSYALQGLRTLKVMLGKAVEWNIIAKRPRIPMPGQPGRDRLIDGATEAALETAYTEPIKHRDIRRKREEAWLVMVILNDSGMRPNEIFPMRIENLDFMRGQIWVPEGKTKNARRWVAMSDRMRQLLAFKCSGRREGWVFPSRRSKSGHLTSIAVGFRAARKRGAIDPGVVPYCARHTYGTYAMEQTGNVFAVSKSMGHGSIRSMEPYQHPNRDLPSLNDAINRRNRNRDLQLVKEAAHRAAMRSGHTSGHTDRIVN